MDYRIEQLRYLLREDPSSRIFFQLGELLRREGDPTGAVEVLKKGLERHPKYVAAWVALGRAHRDLEARNEAMSAFEIALEIDRENPVAARLLGETAADSEDWLGAVKALKLTRALAGGDEELDAKITQVEGYLGENDRLETAPEARPATAKPARCLEVVSLSADDPFAPATGETDDWGPTSDVFEVLETAVQEPAEEGETDAVAATPEMVVEEAPVAIAESEPEEAPADTVEADVHDVPPQATEIEDAAADEHDPADTDLASDETAVDEGSIGAWSAMKAAGVTGDLAWMEPTNELQSGDDDAVGDDPWIEPTAAATGAEVADETSSEAHVVVTADESVIKEAEFTETEASIDVAPGEDLDQSPVEEEIDEPPPVELQEFDPIEVTHPDVVEQQVLEAEAVAQAEAEAAAKAEEEARAQAEAEAQARAEAEAEAAAKAEEEARLKAEAEAAAKAEAEAQARAEAEAEAAAKAEEEARLKVEAEAAAQAEAEAQARAEAEAEAAAKAEEEARLKAEAEAAARAEAEAQARAEAEAEAAAKAEEESRLKAEAEAVARAEAEAQARAEAEAEAAAKAAEAEMSAEDVDGDDSERTDGHHKLSHGVPLPTMTLAKLALDQDDRPLAMATLESLIERDPSNGEAVELLDELRAQVVAVANEKLRAVQATTKIAALQGWLDAVRLAAERRVQ